MYPHPVSYAVRFRASDLYFLYTIFDPKNEKHLVMQSEYARSDSIFFDMRIRWPE